MKKSFCILILMAAGMILSAQDKFEYCQIKASHPNYEEPKWIRLDFGNNAQIWDDVLYKSKNDFPTLIDALT